MGQVIADITVTLDGFIAGPDDGVQKPLGDRGERIHQWLYDSASWRELHGQDAGEGRPDDALVSESFERSGAVVMGKRMFENGNGPNGWGDEPPFHKPVFVLSHEAREPVVKEGTTFTFVSGIEDALEQARVAAGDKDVQVAGGANAVQQFIQAGLLDELQVHVAHVLLGGGIPLFGELGPELIELESTRVVDAPGVTHLRFRFA